jgi:hypothetical protein
MIEGLVSFMQVLASKAEFKIALNQQIIEN